MTRWLLAILFLSLVLSPTLAQDDPETVTLRVAEQCTPNPQMMPFWVLMAQTGGDLETFTIEYIPVTGPPQRMALAVNGDFDVTLAFVFEGANMYTAGGAESLRLETISVWRSFALIAPPGVTAWEDLLGETILLPQRGRGADIVTRQSMRNAGYDPYEDFTIEHLPLASMMPLLVAGDALAATLGGPQVYVIIANARENGIALERSGIDLMEGIYETDQWQDGRLPQGAFIVDERVLEDEALHAAYDQFNQAYHEAAAFAQENPAEAAEMIVEMLAEYCGSRANPQPIEAALADGYILYDSAPVAELMPDLAEYVNTLYGETVDETFYATEAE